MPDTFSFSIHWLTSLPSVFKHTVTPSMLSVICLPADPWQQTQTQMSADILHPYSQSWSNVDCRQEWDVLTFMAGWAGRLSPRDSVYFQACVPVLLLRPPNMPQISWQELGGDKERPNPIQQQGGEQVALGVNCGAGKLYEHPQKDKKESGSEGCLYMHQSTSTYMLGLQGEKIPSTPDANESAIRNKRYIQTITPVQ